MRKKALLILGAALLPFAGKADVDQDFSEIKWPKQIAPKATVMGHVKIEDETLILRTMNDEQATNFSYPTKLKKSDEYHTTFEWKTVNGGPGTVLGLSDWNRKKLFFKIGIEKSKLFATSYSGKKYRYKRLFKPKKNNWYRFTVDQANNSYTLLIEDLGQERMGEETVAYDSQKKKKRLRINTGVTPNQVIHEMWKGQGKQAYVYDNIIVE